MEPPAKRPRTGPSPLGQWPKEDEDDELNYEPDEVSRMRDPGYQLEQSRAFAAFKLKSTFEHIFQKYERDFTGIGDEIDLRTGKIITDNGHLARMRNERDTGIPDEDDEEDEGMLLEDAFASGDEEEDDVPDQSDDEDEEDEERILHGKKDTIPSTAITHKAKTDSQPLPTSRSGSDQRLSDLAPPRQSDNGNSSSSANPWGREPESLDPTWRVPEISPPKSGDELIAKLYGARYRFPVSHGSQSVWASRQDSEQEKAASEPARIDMAQLARARQEASRMARPTSKKLLQAFTTDGDKEDDILGVANADRESRIEKKKKEMKKSGEDVTKDQTSVTAAKAQLHGPPRSVGAEGERPKSPLSGFSVKESGRHKPTKSSAEEKLTSEKQLVPAKVRKSRKTALPTEAFDKGGEEELVDATARLGSKQSLVGISTGKEARTRPRQQIVIELFSRRPQTRGITEVEDPEDIDNFDSAEQDAPMAPKLGGLAVFGPLAKSQVPQEAYGEVIPDAIVSTEATPRKTHIPKEKFTRHEIDPAYAFSDDEDGIPTTRARTDRSQKEYIAVPVTKKFTKRVSAAGMRHPERMPVSEPSGGRQDAEARPETGAQNTNPSPTVDEPVDPSLHRHDVSQAATNVQPPSTFQQSENESDERQPTEQHITGDKNIASAEHLQPTDDVDLQILELLDEFYQETEMHEGVQEDAQKEIQTKKISEATRASDVPVDGVHEEIRTDDSPGENEPREEPSAEDIPQEKNKEVIEPFIIPLGLDEIDETSTTEAGPEPEAMDVELPILPPPTGILSALPRRGRPSSVIHSGGFEKSATSPKRGLNLQSSSPLKRRANPKPGPSPAEARSSVRPRASVSPKRETTPQSHKTAAGWPPALAEQAARSEAADAAPGSPVVGQLSPAPKPPRRKRQPKQPGTPSSNRPRITAKGTSSRKPIISLLSDDDDDDKLTLDLFKTWSPGGESSRDLGGSSLAPALLAGSQTKTATPVKQHIPSGGGTGSGASTTKGRKRKAAWAFATPIKDHSGSPSGSLVRTPGGNMRRCGENGFRCDRDFCFTCL